ncbi:MAG: TAT-variant-translocated molybdopterin oxidoreductase [Verrucomicrobia bacterium]|nr:TAT-variant-translocated molybdopterin oxidoreductase [Verrucomicrobiota bacterium]
MKTIPPPCPEPENGVQYWRSLDQLAGTPAFQSWAEREFPAGASELRDDVTRRDFVRLMSASFLLAGFGLTGCRRPEEKIYPFSKMPENYVHGVPQYYATAMPTRGSAIPLVAKWNDGRPTKVEGNAQHPDSNGGTDLFAQASILNLYDPDRAQRFTKGGNTVSSAQALDFLATLSKQFSANNGEGLCFLMERSSSPSRVRLQNLASAKFPRARWFIYEPIDLSVDRAAANIAFTASGLAAGNQLTPYYRYDQAKVILSLDCDFIGGEEDCYRRIRGFAKGRKIAKAGDKMNRLYAVEALMSQTGANADHRLRVPASAVSQVGAQIAAEIFKQTGNNEMASAVAKLAQGNAANAKWIAECAKDLLANKGAALVVAGHRQPAAVHLLANALNAALGSVGSTVLLHSIPAPASGTLTELTQALTAKQVDTLVVFGGNPAYNAPADLNWAATQRQAKTIVRLGYYEDETFATCDWHLPAAHYLESWGDARTADGTLVPIQPLLEPLFGGVTEIEVLARIGGLDKARSYDIVRETFQGYVSGDVEGSWKKFLHDGFLAGSAAKAVDAKFDFAKAAQVIATATPSSAPSKDKLEVVFHRDYSVDDGRFTNNGWLQELPDPITKFTWDNAVLISRKTAVDLGLVNTDVVEIEVGGRKIQGPVWIQPGQADYTLGLALGYGRDKAGRIGNFKGGKVGFNAYPLRTSAALHAAAGAKVTKTGARYEFSCTQDHWSMEGRPIVREANLDQFNKLPGFAKNMDLDAHAPNAGPIYQHPYDSHPELKSNIHQWGMSIDLNSCVGCSACVIACQSENNIPIVGKEQVGKGREMHWMRIDRYFSGSVAKQVGRVSTADDTVQTTQEWIDEPQVINQPMLCQHCESAPCESVCPVNATVHDEEGVNVMAYNRCVGTRYCSNNCAWKVRRFNFFDYNKRPIESLYQGPLATRPQDEFELAKLVKNPDVTVRMRGVMEKCTFCIQRVESAKIAQKVKAKMSGDVEVPDGTIKTACEQVCPAEAIVFGNILDPNSRVNQLKKQERNYAVLGFLDTKPRTTYLARVRNPNPEMPDFKEHPLPYSLEEYSSKNGNPLESHHGGHATEHAPANGEKGAH